MRTLRDRLQKRTHRRQRKPWRKKPPLLPWLDRLEDRTVPSITLTGDPQWTEQGPGPITENVGINPGPFGIAPDLSNPSFVDGRNPVAGAIEAIAADPS